MTEFVRKVLVYIEWRKGMLSRISPSEVILYILLGGAVLSFLLADVLPLIFR